MKFIHTADWHLGKLVHGVYMTGQQRILLGQFTELVAEEKPDAVIIAGDLYDRSVPPTEAVELLNDVLFTINVELGVPILAVSGNHDSAERLSFGSSWYRNSQFYLQGKITENPEPVRIGGVDFYLVPYAEPGVVREVYGDSSIHSHDDAMRAIVERIEGRIDHSVPGVFVGHAFVLGGKTTDSERVLSVGGSGCVSCDVFSPFQYTALGHLHSPDAIQHERVRYSGSLMKYSFSECRQRKSVSIVHINESGEVNVEERLLTPERDLRELEGYLEELLDPAFYSSQKTDDYLKVTLLDEGALIDPIHKLRQVYPNVLHLDRRLEMIDLKKKKMYKTIRDERKSELELFADFYAEMTTSEFTDEKNRMMADIIQSARSEAVTK